MMTLRTLRTLRTLVLVAATVMMSLFALGQGPAKKIVTLTYTASTSLGVTGYNMWRSNVSGGPYTKITPIPIPGLTCDDVNVVRGNTYFYVGTAVDTGGDESLNSNEAKAVVPPPLQPPATLSTNVHN